MDNTINKNELDDKKDLWITPKALTITGKILGIILALGTSIVHIFFDFEIDMDAINRMAWTLALLGAPIDLSMIIKNWKRG